MMSSTCCKVKVSSSRKQSHSLPSSSAPVCKCLVFAASLKMSEFLWKLVVSIRQDMNEVLPGSLCLHENVVLHDVCSVFQDASTWSRKVNEQDEQAVVGGLKHYLLLLE